MRTNILKIAGSLAFALAAAPAFAHAQLEKATPPVGGTVSPPSEIRLEFSEGVELRFTKVTLSGPGGADVADNRYCSDSITGLVIDTRYPVFDS